METSSWHVLKTPAPPVVSCGRSSALTPAKADESLTGLESKRAEAALCPQRHGTGGERERGFGKGGELVVVGGVGVCPNSLKGACFLYVCE